MKRLRMEGKQRKLEPGALTFYVSDEENERRYIDNLRSRRIKEIFTLLRFRMA